MTMRRWMWIFAAIGAGALLLAAAGRWLLGWGEDGVGTWTGIGAGYLLGALLFRLMPRWWREHCDDEYAQPAGRRYVRALWPVMIGYAITLYASLWLIRRGIDALPLRALVAVAPALVLALLIRVGVRYLREADELQRRIETEAIGGAAMVLAMLYFAAGLLHKARVVAVDAGAAMRWVFPLLMAGYAIAKFFAVRRYR